MSETNEPLADLERVAGGVLKLVDGVQPDQWDLPTPCTEWNVRQLVNHMAAGSLRTTLTLRGAQQQPPAPGQSAEDVLGDRPATACRSLVDDMLSAFAAPGVVEQTFQTPIGPQSGAEFAGMRTHEMLLHGWDLARATGQPVADLPDDVAERSLATMQRFMGDRPRAGSPFAEPQPAPDDAPGVDRFAAFMGRPL